MEQLKRKLTSARRALETLQELLGPDTVSVIVRDAAIQRFEYTFEAVWRTGKLFLREREGLDIGSPKGVIRGFFQVGFFTREQTQMALAMVDDRNLTSHTYNEGVAQQIFEQLGEYAELLARWLQGMEERLQD